MGAPLRGVLGLGETPAMTGSTSPSRHELTGMPFVPPSLVTQGLYALRSRLAWLRRAPVPPAVVALEGVTAVAENRVLGILVELEVADRLAVGPATVVELARGTGVDADPLERVLRLAATRGFVRRDRKGRYRANAFTRALQRDRVQHWRSWVEFAASKPVLDAWARLAVALHGDEPFRVANGTDFFTYVRDHPEFGATFDDAMSAGALLHASLLETALDWTGVHSVCDVGGGTGAVVEVLIRAHPTLRATVLDLPDVVAHARPALLDGVLAERVELVGGDMFTEVPAGHDRYLLLAVLHDWGDDACVRILERISAGMASSGRVVVVDAVIDGGPGDAWSTTTDLLMMALTSGGRERTRAEWDEVFARAGLTIERRHRLATGYTAFELAVA